MPIPTILAAAAGTRFLASHYNGIKTYLEYLLDRPGCSTYRTVAGTIPTATWSAGIGLDAEDYDRDGMHNTATLNSRIVFNTAGRYRVTPRLSFQANGTGIRGMMIRLNAAGDIGTGTFMTQVFSTAVAGQETVLTDAWSRYFNEGDYIEMFGYQTSGGSLGYASGIRKVHLEVLLEGSN